MIRISANIEQQALRSSCELLRTKDSKRKKKIHFLNLQEPSEAFRNLQEHSGTFWNLPEPSGTFRNLQELENFNFTNFSNFSTFNKDTRTHRQT